MAIQQFRRFWCTEELTIRVRWLKSSPYKGLAAVDLYVFFELSSILE